MSRGERISQLRGRLTAPNVLLAVRGLAVVSGEAAQRLAQAICFFLLATVLSPKQFGLAAIAFLAVQVMNSLTYAGLGPATQALGANEKRDRTAVGLALLSGTAGGALLALAAPAICALLQAPQATYLVRLVAISIPLAQISEVQTALIERRGVYSRTAAAQYVASLTSAALGISLALSGAGPVALVAQAISQQAVRLLMLLSSGPDRRAPAFNRKAAGEIWSVGRYLLGTGVILTAYGNFDNATVGALEGPAALGGYGFVYNLANLPYYLIGNASTRVMLPVYAAKLRAREALTHEYVRAVASVALLAALPLGYLAVAGPTALSVLFGDKWSYVGVVLQILAAFAWLRTVAFAASPVFVAFHQADRQTSAQRWMLAFMIVLVIPLTAIFGTVGTAVAVTIPQLVVGGRLLYLSSALAQAPAYAVLARLVMACVLGGATGVVGLVVLVATGKSPAGLVLSLAVTVAAWAVIARVLHVRLGRADAAAAPDAELAKAEQGRPVPAQPAEAPGELAAVAQAAETARDAGAATPASSERWREIAAGAPAASRPEAGGSAPPPQAAGRRRRAGLARRPRGRSLLRRVQQARRSPAP